MNEYSFTFLVSNIDATADDFEDRFFEAGCDDATLALMNGLVAVCFDRESESFLEAVVSSFSDVLKTGACIERFEPDYLVSKQDIAKRANLTPAAVTNYAHGKRGQDFPKPYARITTASPLWDWVEVSDWLYKNDQLAEEDVIHARVSRMVNYHVQHPNGEPKQGDELYLHKFKEAVPLEAAVAC